jgi:hypothetical protein
MDGVQGLDVSRQIRIRAEMRAVAAAILSHPLEVIDRRLLRRNSSSNNARKILENLLCCHGSAGFCGAKRERTPATKDLTTMRLWGIMISV